MGGVHGGGGSYSAGMSGERSESEKQMNGIITFNDRRGLPRMIEFLFAVEDRIIEITTLTRDDVRATQISLDDARRLCDWLNDMLPKAHEVNDSIRFNDRRQGDTTTTEFSFCDDDGGFIEVAMFDDLSSPEDAAFTEISLYNARRLHEWLGDVITGVEGGET